MSNLKKKIINFEHWISSGLNGELTNKIPLELLKLIKESGDSYAYYRNYLFFNFIMNEEEKEVYSDFENFLNESENLPEHERIIKHFSEQNIYDVFSSKRLNVYEISLEKPKRGLSQNACFLYQSYYEIEIILLVFCTFGILNKENRIELKHENLKDRNGNLKKGIAINFILARLNNYKKLKNTFSNAFNIKLRNTIGHNNYRILDKEIRSRDGNITISENQFFESLYNIQNLNNYLLRYMSSKNIVKEDISNCGILAIASGMIDSSPILVIYQLECFYEIDKEKKWLKKVEFNIRNSIVTTNLQAPSDQIGEYNVQYKNWLDLVKKQKKLKTILVPIKPKNGNSKNTIKTDSGEFEVCQKEFEKEINYEVITCHNNGSSPISGNVR